MIRYLDEVDTLDDVDIDDDVETELDVDTLEKITENYHSIFVWHLSLVIKKRFLNNNKINIIFTCFCRVLEANISTRICK